jgi:hypothetical protein
VSHQVVAVVCLVGGEVGVPHVDDRHMRTLPFVWCPVRSRVRARRARVVMLPRRVGAMS